jgi:hypothetical protein
MELNWDAIGAVGEILGAGAVVVSLFYLGIQIRTQNKQQQLAAVHDISTAFRETYTKFNDADIADILVRGNKDFASLTDTEKVRLFATVNPFLKVLEEAHEQYNQGRFDESMWQALVTQYSFFLSAPALEEIWKQRRGHFNPSFRDFVDGLDKTDYGID